MNFSSFVFPLSVTLTNFKDSDKWDSVYTTTQANSAGWESVETQVRSLSDSWEESAFISDVAAASASWNSVYTSSRNNSASWGSVYTTTQANSAGWESVETQVRSLSDSWEESAEIIPTVTNYLSTSNVLVSSLNIAIPYRVATQVTVAGVGFKFFTSRFGENYLVDTRNNVVSTFLPANPTVGQAISYQDPYNTWDSKNFVLGTTDQPIESSLEPLSADVPGYAFTAIFVGSTFGWRLR